MQKTLETVIKHSYNTNRKRQTVIEYLLHRIVTVRQAKPKFIPRIQDNCILGMSLGFLFRLISR